MFLPDPESLLIPLKYAGIAPNGMGVEVSHTHKVLLCYLPAFESEFQE